MKVSIVILNYNKKELALDNIRQCLRFKSAEDEIIVVDNFSDDGSQIELRKLEPQIKLIESNENLGVCGGRNLGFRASKNPIIVYLDDDAKPNELLFDKVRSKFSEDPSVGVIAFRIKHMPDGCIENELDDGEVAHYHGAGHAFRKSVLEKIDYLNDNMKFGAQELESSIRVKLAGYKVIYDSNIEVEHWSYVHNKKHREFRLKNSLYNWSYVYASYFPFRKSAVLITRRLLRFVSFGIKNNIEMKVIF
ncbi:putative glycosyltransferase [Vibrio ishigakensis]|uniref:Putative glycosyltransferase n=1 Tax=Vibrio ishigakensis TaxID=1481914 RepID=A0A0B8QA33_9VIBR|nr:putative glycosyltransferase [Vibrio ishigakensis]